MTEGSSFSNTGKTPAQNDLAALDRQIKEHEEKDSSRSTLGWLVSQVYRADENTLSSLTKLSQEAHAAEQKGDKLALAALQPGIRRAIDEDQDKVGWQDEISRYGAGGLKTAALFLGTGAKAGLLKRGGWIGMAATVGLYGLDNMTMKDDLATGAENFALGGLKGGLLRGTFQAFNKFNIQDIGVKGAALGLSSRIIDMGLTPSTYLDRATGESSVFTGLKNIGSNALDVRALATDAILFSSAHYIAGGANWLTGGAINARPFYNTVMTSSAFGLSNGAYAELQRQKASGEDIDYGKIFKRALIQGGVDAFAGVPGGLHADPAFRKDPLGAVKQDLRTSANNLGVLQDSAAESIARLAQPLNSGPRFAFALAEGTMPSGRMPGYESNSASLTRPYMAMQAETNIPAEIAGGGSPLGIAGKESLPVAEKPVEKVAARQAENDATAKVAAVPATAKQVTGFEFLLGKATGSGATVQDVDTFYTFLEKNTALDGHAAKVYLERYENPSVRGLLEGFYKPPVAGFEPVLENPKARQAYDSLVGWMQQPMVLLAPGKVVDYLNRYLPELNSGDNPVDIRPALKQFAQTSDNPRVVRVLDQVLGTNFEPLLKFHESARTLPISQDALVSAREDARYIWGVKTGAIKPPTEIPSQATAGETGGTGVKVRSFAAPDLESPAGKPGPESNPEVVAKAIAERDRLVTDLASGLTSPDAAVRKQATRDLSGHLDHPSAEKWFETWRQQAADSIYLGTMLNTEAVANLPPDVVRRFLSAGGNTAGGTGGALDSLQSRIMLLNGTMETFAESPDVGRRLVELGENNQQALRDVLYKSGHPKDGEAYRAMLKEKVLSASGLQELASEEAMQEAKTLLAFKDAPEVGRRLVELAGEGKIDLSAIMYRLGHPKSGEQFRALLAERVAAQAPPEKLQADQLFLEMQMRQAYADSPETVQRLTDLAGADTAALQDILSGPRERGVDRAYKALVKELAPNVSTLEQLQQVTAAAKAGNAELAFEAAKAIRPADEAAWMRVQRLIYATATGDAAAIPQMPRATAPARLDSGKPAAGVEEKPVVPDKAPVIPAKPDQNSETPPLVLPEKLPAAGELPVQDPGSEPLPKAVVDTTPAAIEGGKAAPAKIEDGTAAALPQAEPLAKDSSPEPVSRTAPGSDASLRPGTDQIVFDLVGKLNSADEPVRQQAAAELSKYLKHPSAPEWFAAWQQVAPASVNMGFYLKTPEVASLPPELIQRFLTAEQPQPAAETAQPAPEPGRGRPAPRPRQTPADTLQNRLVLLNDTLSAFPDNPQAGKRLLELGAANQQGLRDVLYKLSHQEHGETYRAWLSDRLASAQALEPLTSKSAFDEARILKAFADAPAVGSRLAELGAAGSLDLRNILYRLNNPYAGETYRDLLKTRVTDNVAADELAGDRLFLEAQATRSLGDAPEVVARLVELGASDPKALQDVLNGPRDRQLERGYKELLKQLVPGAAGIEQIQAVATAVKRGNQDQAFAAASLIRPPGEESWVNVQKLIHAVSTGDANALRSLGGGSRRQQSDPAGRQRREYTAGRAPQTTPDKDTPVTPVTPDKDTPVTALTPDKDTPVTALTPDKDTLVTPVTPDKDTLAKPVAPDKDAPVTALTPDKDASATDAPVPPGKNSPPPTKSADDGAGANRQTGNRREVIPRVDGQQGDESASQGAGSFRQRQSGRKGPLTLNEQMSAFEQQQELERQAKQEEWEGRKGKGKRNKGGGRSRDGEDDRYSGKDWRKWLDEDQ